MADAVQLGNPAAAAAGRSASLQNLTDALVASAKVTAGERRREIRDAKVRGLELRVTARGAKSWRYQYWYAKEGKAKRVTLGPYPAHSLADARVWARRQEVEVAGGGDPAAGVAAHKEAPTFAAVSDRWTQEHGRINKRAGSLSNDLSMLRVHILPALGPLKACDITKGDVARMLGNVKRARDARFKPESVAAKSNSEPAAPMSVQANRVFELVRSILWWAEGEGIIADNPAKNMKPPTKKKAETVRDRALSNDEIRNVWNALEAAPLERRASGMAEGVSMTRRLAIAMQLALVMGQRIGEIVGIVKAELHIGDVAPMWIIPKERNKSKREHRMPLSILAVRLIKEAEKLSGESAYLFPGTGKIVEIDVAGTKVRRLRSADVAMNGEVVTKAWERSRSALGLEDVRIHDLRRTVASGMAELGISPFVIGLVLNHAADKASSITQRVYNQYTYDAEKRDALDRWAARLLTVTSGRTGENVLPIFQRVEMS